MLRRSIIALLLAAGLLSGAACKKHSTAASPLAHVDSKQPDKVLYEQAMKALKQKKYDAARITLQTLINAYPDSEYVARAKLSIGEAWYLEGTTAALAQAETEYRDFITFFPNMPEAAEAQLRIADIHFKQMGKPDRDFTHAKRAQEEYRLLLQQYPDSKLVPTARLRLLEVQEVLAEREFRIAHFYFARQSYIAAIARAKTLTDTYPLYSRADEAFYILGQSYEQQAARTRIAKLPDDAKQRLVANYLENAAQAYSRIVTRYPAMPRAAEARSRLAALKQPVPTPTPETVALNKKEMASRTQRSRYERIVADMGKKPDLSQATRVGEPSMADPKETDAPYLVREINSIANPSAATAPSKETGAVQVENVEGATTADQPAPRSTQASTQASDVPAQAPSQLNEAESSASGESTSTSTAGQPAAEPASSSNASSSFKDDAANSSSSRKGKDKEKKKHHFGLPF